MFLMNARGLIAIVVAAGALAAGAQDPKLNIAPKFEAGKTNALTFDIEVSGQGVAISATGVSTTTVKSAGQERVDIEHAWSDTKLIMNDNEQPMPSTPFEVTLGANGDPTSISGGPQGGPNVVYVYFLMHFPRPDKALAKGESTTFTLAGNNDAGIPARKVTESFLGPEEIAGKPANKFSVKVEEQKGIGFTLDGTFWVTDDGTVVKEDASFDNLATSDGDSTFKGTVKAEAKA